MDALVFSKLKSRFGLFDFVQITYSFRVLLISEEEAKKKIYNVSCERYFGFGCEIGEETSNKLEGTCCFSLSIKHKLPFL